MHFVGFVLQQQTQIMGNYCCSQENNKFNTLVSNKFSQNQITSTNKNISSDNFLILNHTCKKLKKKNSFRKVAKIGDGGQSRVYLSHIELTQANLSQVENSQVTTNYALKQISKKDLISDYQVSSIILQKSIMESINNNFIEKLQYYFEDEKNIYMFKKVADGGDLYSILLNTDTKGSRFRKLQGYGLKFVLSGVILGLDALHSQNIIYRDLKTQNILVNDKGYPYLTDFGLSIQNNPQITQADRRGTYWYLAPEMLNKDSEYDHAVDLWALGILIFFILYEEYPFTQKQIHSQKFNTLTRNRQNSYHKTGYSSKFFKENYNLKDELLDLMNKLLKFSPQERIGYESISQIKQHSFFAKNQDIKVYWNRYQSQQLQSPLLSVIFEDKKQYEDLSDLSDYIQSPETRCSNQDSNLRNFKCNLNQKNLFSEFHNASRTSEFQ